MIAVCTSKPLYHINSYLGRSAIQTRYGRESVLHLIQPSAASRCVIRYTATFTVRERRLLQHFSTWYPTAGQPSDDIRTNEHM